METEPEASAADDSDDPKVSARDVRDQLADVWTDATHLPDGELKDDLCALLKVATDVADKLVDRDDVSTDICECGLHWQLCCALAHIETMCVAAVRGEVVNAQLCAGRALELLREGRS